MLHPFDELHALAPAVPKPEENRKESALVWFAIGILAASVFALTRKQEHSGDSLLLGEDEEDEGEELELEDEDEDEDGGSSEIAGRNPYTVNERMKDHARESYALGFIKIDPKDFLDLTTWGENYLYGAPRWIHVENNQKGMDYQKFEEIHAKEKSIIHPHLTIDIRTGKVTGHEGRHRAAAAEASGEDFYIYIYPDYESKTRTLKDDVMAGNGEKYIPDVLIGQFNPNIKVKLAKSTLKQNPVPPASVAAEAKQGLKLRTSVAPSRRGGTAVGIARAKQLSSRQNISDSTVKRMKSFFARHEVDKKAKGFRRGEVGYPSKGLQAWKLWGGDSGKAWASKMAKKSKR